MFVKACAFAMVLLFCVFFMVLIYATYFVTQVFSRNILNFNIWAQKSGTPLQGCRLKQMKNTKLLPAPNIRINLYFVASCVLILQR